LLPIIPLQNTESHVLFLVSPLIGSLMKILVLVEASPLQQRNSSAYRFCHACLQAGQTIEQVFFFGDGTLTANLLSHPPQDEINWTERWSKWACTHQIPLKCCITSAMRRGIVGETDSHFNTQAHYSCHSAFEVTGLGQMMMAMKQADRIIQF
jgi:tRNA 2-thiouridine synthesizing protein D